MATQLHRRSACYCATALARPEISRCVVADIVMGAEYEVAGVITQRAHSRGASTRRSCLRQIRGIRRDKNEHVGLVDDACRTHCRL